MISIPNIPQEKYIFLSPPALRVAKELVKDKGTAIPLVVRLYVPIGEIWLTSESIEEMDRKYEVNDRPM